MAKAMARADALGVHIEEVEATLNRGYALHRQTLPHAGLTMCYRRDIGQFPCERVRRTVLETPVSVDMAAQRDKLARLKKQRIQALKYALQQRDTCAAL